MRWLYDIGWKLKDVRKSIARLKYHLGREINPWEKIRIHRKLTRYEVKKQVLELKEFEKEQREEIKRIKELKRR